MAGEMFVSVTMSLDGFMAPDAVSVELATPTGGEPWAKAAVWQNVTGESHYGDAFRWGRPARPVVAGQVPLMVLMMAFTVGGLTLLFST